MNQIIPKFKQILLKSEPFDFESLALEAFNFQAENCLPYKDFLSHLGFNPNSVKKVEEIPFLPISLFKKRDVVIDGLIAEKIFHSSGTSGQDPSKKILPDLEFYQNRSKKIFKEFYPDHKNYQFHFLFPGYGRIENSSLLTMAEGLTKISGDSLPAYFYSDASSFQKEFDNKLESDSVPIIFAVTHALLDLKKMGYSNSGKVIVIETGGMKGLGKELIRAELHEEIKKVFPNSQIGSEYGMAELMSQAYATSGSWFKAPPGMEVLIKDISDPFSLVRNGRIGNVNIIDLANIESCCFIATDDLGRKENTGFEILGRLDQSELRGCNLMSS